MMVGGQNNENHKDAIFVNGEWLMFDEEGFEIVERSPEKKRIYFSETSWLYEDELDGNFAITQEGNNKSKRYSGSEFNFLMVFVFLDNSEVNIDESIPSSACSSTLDLASSCSSSSLTLAKTKKLQLWKITSCISTQSRCFICGLSNNGRLKICKKELKRVWNAVRVKVPPSNRCCRSHFLNKKLTDEALGTISKSSEPAKMTLDEIQDWILELSNEKTTNRRLVDFDSECKSKLSHHEYIKDIANSKGLDPEEFSLHQFEYRK